MTAPRTRSRQPRPLDAWSFQPEVSSFRLHLAAEGKAAKTITTYTQAVQWFAAGFLLPQAGHARWEEVVVHGCDADSNHGSMATKRPIKIQKAR